MYKWYSLYDKIYRKENIERAFEQVKRNQGSPGVDGETVLFFELRLRENIELIHEELKTKTYKPSAVRRVEIEKPDGGVRLLGVPTVKDRVVQQAVVNILDRIFDKDFHPSSYGYRKGKSQHNATKKATMFMRKYGLEYVVDMDLSKCFDTLDHEIIIDEVAKKISDSSVLGLIRKFLKSGVIKDGAFEDTEIGSPQGGVISPLLSNIYLNIFDQEMKSRNIRIVRYADDILVFADSKENAHRYKQIAESILEDKLKLTVNRQKTKLTRIGKGVDFLGVLIYRNYIGVQPKRLKRFKDKIRLITKRNQPTPLPKVINKLNPLLRGWINYYKVGDIKGLTRKLMEWIRRRLRMIKLKQWKRFGAVRKEMRRRKITSNHVMNPVLWKNSKCQLTHLLLPNKLFEEMKLFDLESIGVGLLSRKR